MRAGEVSQPPAAVVDPVVEPVVEPLVVPASPPSPQSLSWHSSSQPWAMARAERRANSIASVFVVVFMAREDRRSWPSLEVDCVRRDILSHPPRSPHQSLIVFQPPSLNFRTIAMARAMM